MMNIAETDEYYKKMTTTEMTALYEVIAFSHGICTVKRKSDGKRGFLNFDHMPRFYWGFQEVSS